MNILLVFVGGGIGSVARYALGLAIGGVGWTWGTLAVNALGSFLIGVLGSSMGKADSVDKTILERFYNDLPVGSLHDAYVVEIEGVYA